jgi:hypothetical protein
MATDYPIIDWISDMGLSMTKYLAKEDHFTVWDVVGRHMRKPFNLFSGLPNATAVLKVLFPSS